MKYELKTATVGLVDWLRDIRKHPALTKGECTIAEVGEICWAFTLPLEEIEKLSPAQLKAAVKKFNAQLEADTFQEMQRHAEKELMKFTETATQPKKPKPRSQAKKRVRVKR